MRVSKLRIGDLVYYDNKKGLKGNGLITAISAWWVGNDCVELLEKTNCLQFICPKEIIVKIISREELPKKWWKYL